MEFTKKNISIIVIVIILGIWFFPKDSSTCDEAKLCFGYVKTDTEKYTWLNRKDSVLGIVENKVKSCIGHELQQGRIYDGCPGDWGGWTWTCEL